MQNDFITGSLAIPNTDTIIKGICSMIDIFASKNSKIIATKDYHPKNHCSFSENGGLFPSHCIQNTHGSYIEKTISDKLQEHLKNVSIVFKGFSPDIDSYAAFTYDSNDNNRVAQNKCGCFCNLSWTGSFALYSSTMEKDINAPPDVMSILTKIPLNELLISENLIEPQRKKKLFVCGLTLDYCVIDTAINASIFGFKVYIFTDLTMMINLHNLSSVKEKMNKYDITFIT
ncbi:putative isochorismatase hydrolase [Bodo saltans virus]|uniref:Isochorismatase hydrolase n=1 Tax=Bodo saltans virus TaxID=2024608 RepID=A0A2H4UW48_9VIRU|nr:putative isochorismatase hydrolase [Bodo saltans virus]ATZ81117.1 putative isochorismatase hydrolase [Bodo saltans virus]